MAVSQSYKQYLPYLFKKSLPMADFYCGLIGCGHFARYAYVPALNRGNNPIVCSGLYSRSIKSSRYIRKSLRYKTKAFRSYAELADSGIKAVIITSPNHSHYHYASESLNRNLDVFCEKPVTNNLIEAMRLKSILKERQKILMVAFNQRYLDRISKLKQLINQGRIGKIAKVQAYHNQNIEDYLLQSDWLNDTNKSGGGVIHNAGVHLINVLLYIFGSIDIVSAKYENKKLPNSFGEDTASCKFIFKSGVEGFLEASLVNAVDSTYEHIIIHGDKGIIMSDMLQSNITIKHPSSGYTENIECKKESIPDSVYKELVHFYSCIKDKKMPDTGIDDSIETLKIVEAARISSAEKSEVCVNKIESQYFNNV